MFTKSLKLPTLLFIALFSILVLYSIRFQSSTRVYMIGQSLKILTKLKSESNAPTEATENTFVKNLTEVIALTEPTVSDEERLSNRAEENIIETIVYAITPTYQRLTQKADLVRLKQTLLNVPNLHWIVVEDSVEKTPLVKSLLLTSGLSYTHLNLKTQDVVKKDSNGTFKTVKTVHRGVDQRNAGLKSIRNNVTKNKSGVVYFMDDDNTYSLRLFEELRTTKVASCWLIAFAGGSKVEGPGKCENGKVLSWYAVWGTERKFTLDMSAFAVNLKLIFKYINSVFANDCPPGYLENNFLLSLHLTRNDLEAKANCTEVLAWHTKTQNPNIVAKPNVPKEIAIIKEGVEV